ncbi:flagellar hook-associated protein FlgK [Rhodospirillaceae bacterium SYSU D60014]|uniref:flagellar hook-associated protein FlgK n=1 Tax=Virgifigura deserti TaxID=2268457 RepID=UPI000E666D9D
MSLNIALLNALTGLQTTQAGIQVTSNNITNANTPGYTRKIVSQEAMVIGNVGAGVRLTDIERIVDDHLLREVRSTAGTLGGLQVQDSYFARMQDMFGTPESNSSISASISRFSTALQALAANPESMSQRLGVVDAGKAVARQLNTMSSDIQTLRLEADNEIANAVATVNEQLEIIDELNEKITRSTILNEPTAELEDKRDIALDKISEQIDISYFTRDNGEMVIFTRNGRALLDRDVQPLSHTPASSMTAGFTYPGPITGIDLGGADITNEIRSGRIAALIDMRDSTLPDMTAQINNLSVMLRDEVNRIHNEGTGLPAATTLTSSRAQAGTAASFTGPVQIALVNPDGTQAFTATMPAPGTLDAAGFAAAINAALGGSGGSATEAGGIVTVDGAGFGVVISGGTVDPGGGAPTTNLSDFLHLNDFFVGDDPAGIDLASVLSVRSDIVANPHLVSRGALQQDTVTLEYYVSAGDNTVAQRLADKFSEQLTFAAAGGLSQTGTTLGGYATSILSTNSTNYANVTDQLSFQQSLHTELNFKADSLSGVNMDEELSNLIVLQNAYAASARMISTAAEMFDVLTNMGR